MPPGSPFVKWCAHPPVALLATLHCPLPAELALQSGSHFLAKEIIPVPGESKGNY